MASSVILRNLKQVGKNLEKNLNYVDLNYTGPRDASSGNPNIKLEGGSPILNEYKLWLRSGFNDYIRQPNKGGFFAYNLNNYPFDPSSESLIKNDLVAKTKELFPNISVLDCEVECLPVQRKWKVKVVVGDNTTGLIGADMATNGESIIFNVNSTFTE